MVNRNPVLGALFTCHDTSGEVVEMEMVGDLTSTSARIPRYASA
jgi:hypothetical protein